LLYTQLKWLAICGYPGWNACGSLCASSIERPLTIKFAVSEVEKNGGSWQQQMKTACPQ